MSGLVLAVLYLVGANSGEDSSAVAAGATAAPDGMGSSTSAPPTTANDSTGCKVHSWPDRADPPVGYICPDALSVTKSGPAVGAPAPNSDLWAISLTYHWVGDAGAVGKQAILYFRPDWAGTPGQGCLQAWSPDDLPTITIQASGIATSYYGVGRINNACGPGSYTASSWVIDFVSTDRRSSWGRSSNTPPVTMTVR